MANKPTIVIGDYCEDTYVYARERRSHHLSEPETPIKEYPFEPVRVPVLARGLGQYLKDLLAQDALFENKRPEGRCAQSMFLVSPQKQNGRTIWCIDQILQLPPGQRNYAVTAFDSATRTYETLRTSDDIPIFCMDYDLGWREKHSATFAKLVKKRRYIIRCHDPRRNQWEAFRKSLSAAEPGIWLCHSVDVSDGALRAPGVWEDHRGRIVGWFQQDETLWSPTRKQWLHHIIIKIDQDGVLILGPSTSRDGILYISAGDQPGSFIRKHPHHVVGNGLVFFASFARAVTEEPLPQDGREMQEKLEECSKEALARSREMTAGGYKEPEDREDLYRLRGIRDLLPVVKDPRTDFLVKYEQLGGTWTEACEIVYGYHSKFLKSTVFTLGKLATADSRFARSLLTLESRLKEHRDSGTGILSFAVFGDPGSGKSFVAKELIRSLDPGGTFFESLIFNLSQFGGRRDRLVAALQKIESAAKSKIPFVLWDEFDTAIQGEKCGWLPDFLMPMQDAKFFEGARTGELGKCVFAFMGSIFHNDEDFLDWTRKEGELLKGPDFHSRLQSSLPLPRVTVESGIDFDSKEQLTRAILIRTYLRNHKSIKLISQDVLAFLLHVPLLHGPRSLEQIIIASALRDTEIYSRWHLPSIDVLRLHIKDFEKKFVDQEKPADEEKSLDLVARFVKRHLKKFELIGEKYLPLLWRSYLPSISKGLSIDLNDPMDEKKYLGKILLGSMRE